MGTYIEHLYSAIIILQVYVLSDYIQMTGFWILIIQYYEPMHLNNRKKRYSENCWKLENGGLVLA